MSSLKKRLHRAAHQAEHIAEKVAFVVPTTALAYPFSKKINKRAAQGTAVGAAIGGAVLASGAAAGSGAASTGSAAAAESTGATLAKTAAVAEAEKLLQRHRGTPVSDAGSNEKLSETAPRSPAKSVADDGADYSAGWGDTTQWIKYGAGAAAVLALTVLLVALVKKRKGVR